MLYYILLDQIGYVCFDFSVDNVTFVDMSDCQTVWPNSQNCIKLKFGIHLETRSNTTTTKGNDSNIYEPELCEKHLVAMWTNFGRSELLKNGFKVTFRLFVFILQIH